MMCNMADKPPRPLYFRTTPRYKAALKRLLIDLGEIYSSEGWLDELTQEVFVSATWAWMHDYPARELATILKPYVRTADEEISASGRAKARAKAASKQPAPPPLPVLAPGVEVKSKSKVKSRKKSPGRKKPGESESV